MHKKIADLETEAKAELVTKRARELASQAARHASFVEWLTEQTPSFQALASELFDIQTRHGLHVGFAVHPPEDREGQVVYVVRMTNGHHESLVSYEAALESMVDAWRTRVEDLESTRKRVLAVHGDNDHKRAGKVCADIGRRIKAENPGMPGEERDALVLAEIAALEKGKPK